LNTKPDIFIPNSTTNPLIDVLLEKYDKYEILWYHWKYDGPPFLHVVKRTEDFEPIIIVYNDKNSISCVITRRAWEYRIYDSGDGLILPPVLLFEEDFHHPLLQTKKNRVQFNQKASLLVQEPYRTKSITHSQISPKFRIGKGHFTNLPPRRISEPKDIAQKAYEYYK